MVSDYSNWVAMSRRSRQEFDSREIHRWIHTLASLSILFGSRRGRGFMVVLLILGAIGVAAYVGYRYYSDPNHDLKTADALWNSDAKIDAIKQYKTLLREKDPLAPESNWLLEHRARLYRRIISFEANYGSRAEARDWIRDAWMENIRALSFERDETRQLWDDVVLPLAKHRQAIQRQSGNASELAKADFLWKLGRKKEAVHAYKHFLQTPDRFSAVDKQKLPELFSRVIGHEMRGGTGDQVRRWMENAYHNDIRDLPLDPAGQAVWQQVVTQIQDTGSAIEKAGQLLESPDNEANTTP